MEDQKKELLDFAARIEGVLKDVLWPEWDAEDQNNFNALRRLVEKFYGNFKPRADRWYEANACFALEIPKYLLNFIEDIHDFDPMAAEDKEKIKMEVK